MGPASHSPAFLRFQSACRRSLLSRRLAFLQLEPGFPHLTKSRINIKELAAIAVALQRWAPALHGHHVVVLTDSTCAAGMLNKGSSSHRTALDLLKQIAKCCLTYDIAIEAVHIPGHTNEIADAITTTLLTPGIRPSGKMSIIVHGYDR